MHVQQEEGQLSRKNHKSDRMVNTNTLTEDDPQELANIVAKFVQDNLANLRMQQLNIATQVQDHLIKLIEALQDVKGTVEAETYCVDPNVSLVTPALVSSIKVVIQRQELEADTETSAGSNDNSVQIDFSKLALE